VLFALPSSHVSVPSTTLFQHTIDHVLCARHVSHAEEPGTPHLHIHIPLPFGPTVVGSNFTKKTTVQESQRLFTGFVSKIVLTADQHFHTVESVTSIFIIYFSGSIRGLFGIVP